MSPADASSTRQRAVPVPSPAATPVRLPWARVDDEVPAPGYARAGDAGADLMTTADVLLAPGQRAVVGTGVAIALPPGFAGFVHPRSGLAARHGLGIVNAPGVIDAGYRGEIKVCLVNHDPAHPIALRRGDRIAQLVVQRVEQVEFELVDALTPSARGARGYGSTGVAGVLPSNPTVETAEPAVRDGKD